MKKVYNAPKAEKLAFESKDIITASRMLSLGKTAGDNEISSIDWDDFQKEEGYQKKRGHLGGLSFFVPLAFYTNGAPLVC